MHEEGTDSGGIVGWVEQIVDFALHLVATIERLALAPTAAANDVIVRDHDVIGAVRDHLAIDTEDVN